tara:strand:+ start:231 stop:653 length:423 start_codon:yes stop_codon:yes gene_type:complete
MHLEVVWFYLKRVVVELNKEKMTLIETCLSEAIAQIVYWDNQDLLTSMWLSVFGLDRFEYLIDTSSSKSFKSESGGLEYAIAWPPSEKDFKPDKKVSIVWNEERIELTPDELDEFIVKNINELVSHIQKCKEIFNGKMII